MKTELRDKWVLITGASSGFGAAAARAFGAEGARLLLGARELTDWKLWRQRRARVEPRRRISIFSM